MMSRISTPASIDDAPQASRALLDAVKAQLGVAPNLFRMVANSPAALEGYVGMLGALGKGALPVATRERLAITVAEANGCDYCLSAHTYLGKQVAKLDDVELSASRNAESRDPKVAAALRFARTVMDRRGHVSDSEVRAVRDAGFDDAQIIEIVMHVGLNTWTNYINSVARTDIDFPVVSARKAA
jgi:uncharacterized peroxidase-related enzyme